MDLIQRDLDLPLRESHDVPQGPRTSAIGNEDRSARLEATHSRVMCRLVAERDCHAGRKRLVSHEEPR
jgi:hypothetical protein